MTKERLLELAALEDGCEIGVGGLLVDLGLYKAPAPEPTPPPAPENSHDDCTDEDCPDCISYH